jgi:hypothetical protein
MMQEKSKEKIKEKPVSLFQLTEYKDINLNQLLNKNLNDSFRLQ